MSSLQGDSVELSEVGAKEGKKVLTDEERLALADKLDKDLDEWINGLEKKTYTEGWPEDKWEKEMEKHPFFMTKFPENHADASPLLQGIQQLKYDDTANSPIELAQSYKEDGNFNFKHQKYRMAVLSYTEGIRRKCGDSETESALYNNRSAAQFFLKNYGSSLMDCKQCLRINPDHDKARLRAIQCCIQLKKPKDALTFCKDYLKKNPDCDRGIAYQTDAMKQLKKMERDNRRAEKENSYAQKELENLMSAISLRDVKIEVNGDVDEVLLGMHEKPKLQSDNSLTWPVFFLYPEYSTSDFVQDFNENSTMLEMLTTIMENPADWDERKDYRPDDLTIYYEADDRSHLYRVNMESTLAAVIKAKGFVARDFRPAFLVFVRNSSAETSFIKNYTVF